VEHSGPSAEAAGSEPPPPIPADAPSDSSTLPPPIPVSAPQTRPTTTGSGRYEPTILVVQAVKAGPQWRSLWHALTQGPILSPTCVWTRRSLAELRDWLWAAEAGLDRRRREHKRRTRANRETGAAVMGVASVVAGASAVVPTAGASTSDAGRAWFGYEDAADRSLLVPERPPCVAWDASTCDVHYSSLEALLFIDGLFIAHLLPALISAAPQPPLPTTLPRSIFSALCVEDNPRRRLALLQTLRVLAAICVADPDAQDAKWDSGAIPRVTGVQTLSPPPLPFSSFELPDLVVWCAMVIGECTVGLADVGGGSEGRVGSGGPFGPLAGSDGGYISTSNSRTPALAGVFGHIVRAHAASASTVSADGVRKLPPSALWPSDGDSKLSGGGELPYWLALHRSECVLLLRLLLSLSTNARRFQSVELSSLLPLLRVPGYASEEPPKPAPPAIGGLGAPTSNEAAEGASGNSTGSAADSSGSLYLVQYSRACARFVSATVSEASRGVVSASDSLTVAMDCDDVGLPDLASGASWRTVAHPFPSFALQARQPNGAAPILSVAVTEEAALVDPDELLVVRRAALPRSILGRAAADALFAAVSSWPPVAQRFAREDVMQVRLMLWARACFEFFASYCDGTFASCHLTPQSLVLPLLQAPSHPRLVGSTLRLLRAVLAQLPLYAPALSRHALTQAVLLTAMPPKVVGSIAQIPAAVDLNAAVPATEGVSSAYATLGIDARGGLCAEAAAILYDTHLAAHDADGYGWAELASAPPRAAARLLIDDNDTGIAAPSRGHVGYAREDRSNAVFRWTAAHARAADHSATSSSSLAPYLPAALIKELQVLKTRL
jgi:hypothetical protein